MQNHLKMADWKNILAWFDHELFESEKDYSEMEFVTDRMMYSYNRIVSYFEQSVATQMTHIPASRLIDNGLKAEERSWLAFYDVYLALGEKMELAANHS